MSEILYEELDHGVGRLILNSGSGNPITPSLLETLNSELGRIAKDAPRSLVIDGGEGSIFSGGFALPVIADWEREEIRAFFGTFLDAIYKIMLMPCPTVAAINGHTIAGGFILSLATDLRIVKSGKLKLGLSEVDLGVCVPAGPQVLLAARTSEAHALRVGMLGHLFNGEEAVRIGYAADCVEDARAGAVDYATRFAKKPGHGSGETSRLYSEGLVERVKTADAQYMEAFLDSWFSEVGQKCIKGLAAKLSGK
jgi:3,2-trans-enoyl-CoA isomerase